MNTLHSLPCHHLRERSHRITLLVAGKLPSAQVLLPSLEERRKVGSQLSTAASPHSWSGLCGQRPPALGQQGQVATCAPEAWPVPAHGVQSPGRRGAPGAAGRCSSNPGERAHPLTPKKEPHGGPGTARPRPEPSPAPRWGRMCSHRTEPFTSLYSKWVTTPLNCPQSCPRLELAPSRPRP